METKLICNDRYLIVFPESLASERLNRLVNVLTGLVKYGVKRIVDIVIDRENLTTTIKYLDNDEYVSQHTIANAELKALVDAEKEAGQKAKETDLTAWRIDRAIKHIESQEQVTVLNLRYEPIHGFNVFRGMVVRANQQAEPIEWMYGDERLGEKTWEELTTEEQGERKSWDAITRPNKTARLWGKKVKTA